MRTTLDIDDALLLQAKLFAAREHTSLTRLIEESLSLRLRTAQASGGAKPRPTLPVFAGQGGLRPTVRDTLSQRALLDAADEADLRQ
jgi:hypothetical protein